MIAAAATSSEGLWAEHGLTGLVLFALFALIGLFIRVISEKDKGHQKFVKTILDDSREERKSVSEIYERNTDKLSQAIDGLAKELRDD